jgi:prepilin-type N-terminal cleavage/methylation domain-containing protein
MNLKDTQECESGNDWSKKTMKTMQKDRHSTQRGFSLVELVVVMGLMLVLSAIAVPSVLSSISAYRLNDAATSMQNIVEVARLNAIRRNTEIDLRQAVINGQTVFYVDLQKNLAYVNTDPAYFVPLNVQLAPGGAPAAGTTGLANTAALGGGCIGFNSRGTVTYATCGAGVQSVWFLSMQLTNGTAGFRAITVTPMGQAKSWTAQAGGTWSRM